MTNSIINTYSSSHLEKKRLNKEEGRLVHVGNNIATQHYKKPFTAKFSFFPPQVIHATVTVKIMSGPRPTCFTGVCLALLAIDWKAINASTCVTSDGIAGAVGDTVVV